MDIDEFLDRELADLNTGEPGIGSPDGENANQQPKDNLVSGELSAETKLNLTKANLEQAEISYNQLWRVLMQQNIKWDKNLYEQLSGLAKKFSSTLSQAYDEMKNKAGRIYELIGRARSFMKDNKKDIALKIYSQVQELSNSIPNTFFQEKRALQEQINILYRDIISATDAELIKKVFGTMQEINQNIGKINACITSGNIENISASYIKCIELYNQIPEGFLKEKNSAGMQLLDFYRSLSISAEIKSLQKQMGQSGQQQAQFKQQPVRAFTKPDNSPRPIYQRQPAARQFENKFEIKSLPKQNFPKKSKPYVSESSSTLNKKRESAKRNIKKGFYDEAWKNIEEALQADPNDVESKALRAKIKTLQ